MKTLLPNTKFYNFGRKFWQVTALSCTFLGPQEGGRNFIGGGPLCPPGTAPGCEFLAPILVRVSWV